MYQIWTTIASMMAAWALLQTLIPASLRHSAAAFLRRLNDRFSSDVYYDITEVDNGVATNELYLAVQTYLTSTARSNRLSLTRQPNASSLTYSLSSATDYITDTFKGCTVLWEHAVTQRPAQGGSFSWRPLPDEKRGFTLRVRKKDKNLVLDEYLRHVSDTAEEIRRKTQDRFIYTNAKGGPMDARGLPWEPVPFKHPSTFDTLAMDPLKKQEIMFDLREFAQGEAFYQKTGRAWKRGYLLYGPPGTGKSSMIAAIANFLRYDIYDLELTEVSSNSELRKLLMKTTSKSVIVIEDIDCSVNLTKREKKPKDGIKTRQVHDHETDSVEESWNNNNSNNNNNKTITLSGLLNFTDGLWSCCGSERIFIFTTNHIERLDPALLRSGRMDMHIHMSYCTYPMLRILLKNYLGIDDFDDVRRDLLLEVEDVILDAEMTPADVSEMLIRFKKKDRDLAVAELLKEMRVRVEGKKVMMRDDDEELEKRALDSPKEGCDESTNESEDDNEKENIAINLI